MAIFVSSTRVQELLTDAWTRRGYHVLAKEHSEAALRDVDFIWADLPSIVKLQPALLEFIKQAPSDRTAKFPYICVVYSAETELLAVPASPWVLPVSFP